MFALLPCLTGLLSPNIPKHSMIKYHTFIIKFITASNTRKVVIICQTVLGLLGLLRHGGSEERRPDHTRTHKTRKQ